MGIFLSFWDGFSHFLERASWVQMAGEGGSSLILCVHLGSAWALLHIVLTLRLRLRRTPTTGLPLGPMVRTREWSRLRTRVTGFCPESIRIRSSPSSLAKTCPMASSDFQGTCSFPCAQGEENCKYKQRTLTNTIHYFSRKLRFLLSRSNVKSFHIWNYASERGRKQRSINAFRTHLC